MATKKKKKKTYRKLDGTTYTIDKDPTISFVPGSNTQVIAHFEMNAAKRSKVVKEYKLQWVYQVGAGSSAKNIEGSTDTIQPNANGALSADRKTALYNISYSPPSDAVGVCVKVTVVGKTYKYDKKVIKKKKTTYKEASATYKGSTKTSQWFWINANKTVVPSAPTASLNAVDNLQLDYEITDDNLKNTHIRFQVFEDDTHEYHMSGLLEKGNLKTTKESYRVNPGHKYKVRCQGYSSTYDAYSEWSGYSSEVITYPMTPTEIRAVVVGVDGTDVRVSWNSSGIATSYEIAYTNDPSLFGQSDGVSTVSTSDASTSYTFANNSTLSLGKTWYFKVRAKNSGGESPYSSGYAAITIGKKPSAPTTWSSTTRVGVGETPILYWVHNATDGSSQTWAQIMVTVNGSSKTLTWQNTRVGDERDATVEYKLDASDYAEGSKIYWKVRTKGAMTADQYWSDWSEERTIDIYPKPTISISVTGDESGISSFPIKMEYITGPNSQIPVTFHVQIFAKENYWYDTYDDTRIMVFSGDEIFSKIIDSKDKSGTFEIKATDVHLENAIKYTFKCTVYMESGLSASYSVERLINMSNANLSPQVIISDIDSETMSIEICPYCEDTSKEIPEGSDDEYITPGEDSDDAEFQNPQVYELAENVVLDVYRINYDGTFTKINKTQVENTRTTWLHDPHPPLNQVQYRIVATSTITGASVYNDTDAEPVGTALAPEPVPIIIQWGEQWTDTEYPDESYAGASDMDNDPTYLGNILKLPYNIDISDNNDKDVECIKYVGRQHPVSYYGTQLGVVSTWKTDVPKTNMDTLSMLRRLSIYMGDCYVREPSGSGYWANVAVSFEQTHNTLVIPVTLTLTRVEGDA